MARSVKLHFKRELIYSSALSSPQQSSTKSVLMQTTVVYLNVVIIVHPIALLKFTFYKNVSHFYQCLTFVGSLATTTLFFCLASLTISLLFKSSLQLQTPGALVKSSPIRHFNLIYCISFQSD